MTLAIRRCSRVGRNGLPLEDQGVEADLYYSPYSAKDVILGNPGILRRACRELIGKSIFRIDASAAILLPDGSVSVEAQTTNIALLKFFLNGHLALAVGPTSNTHSYSVPELPGLPVPSALRIEGYSADAQPPLAHARGSVTTSEPGPLGSGCSNFCNLALVRARTISLEQPPAPDDFDPAQSIDGIEPGDVSAVA